MRNGQIVSVTDLFSSGGHYEVTFNALRHRALWGLNDRKRDILHPLWYLDTCNYAVIMRCSPLPYLVIV